MRDFYTRENMQGEAFHVRGAGLVFEPAGLSFEIEAGSAREGVIRVRHRAGKPARGYVYPADRSLLIVREQFAPSADGTGMIRWQFDARGLAPGRTVRSSLRVVSPYGEYRIPCEARVSGKGQIFQKKSSRRDGASGASRIPAASESAASMGAAGASKTAGTADAAAASGIPGTAGFTTAFRTAGVNGKKDFLALAEADFPRAAELFYRSRFEEILEPGEDRTLYRGLSMQEGNLRNVEEFLIAACGKEKTLYEPVEKSLFLLTELPEQGRPTGGARGRIAGNRAERALQAHRERVRNSGVSGIGIPAQGKESPKEELFLLLTMKKTGTAAIEPVIRAEGGFLPAAPFGVSEALVPGREGENDLTIRISVNRSALHAGRNFGRILIQGPFNEAEVPVEVRCRSTASALRRRQERETELLQLQLMRMYVDFCLNRSSGRTDPVGDVEAASPYSGRAFNTGDPGEGSAGAASPGRPVPKAKEPVEDWFARADRLIDELALRRKDLMPRLYGVHLLLLRGQEAEAERELGRIALRYGGAQTMQAFGARFTGEREDAYCYRQYLYARCRKGRSQDPESVRLTARVVRFLHGVYRQAGDWRIAWMLVDLSEEYAPGTPARWNFLRRQFEGGCHSPVILLEAWEMVRRDPQILLPGSGVQERWAKDEFGLQVLWYAARNNVLTPKAARVMILLAEKKKTFSPTLFKGLCAARGLWEEQEGRGDAPVSAASHDSGETIGNPVPAGRAKAPGSASDEKEEIGQGLLRAICILLLRNQDVSSAAHGWYERALEEGVSLTGLEEGLRRSAAVSDPSLRMPEGYNAVLRTREPRAVRAVLVYDRFRREQVFPVRRGMAVLPIFGDANTVFLEDGEGNRYAKSLPFTLVFVPARGKNTGRESGSEWETGPKRKIGSERESGPERENGSEWKKDPEKRIPQAAGAGRGKRPDPAFPVSPFELADRIGFGKRKGAGPEAFGEDAARAAIRLLESGELTGDAQAELLLRFLSLICGRQEQDEAGADRDGENRDGHTAGGADHDGEDHDGHTAGGSDRDGRNTGRREDAGGRLLQAGTAVRADTDASMPVEATKEEWLRLFLQKADPSRCRAGDRARLLFFLVEAGEYARALRWLVSFGDEEVEAELLAGVFLGIAAEGAEGSERTERSGHGTAYAPAAKDGGRKPGSSGRFPASGAQGGLTPAAQSLQSAAVDMGWRAFLRGSARKGLFEALASSFEGLGEELLRLRKGCAAAGIPTGELDRRIIRQCLYTGEVLPEHAGVISAAGEGLGEILLPALAQYADYAFSTGVSMGGAVTGRIVGCLTSVQKELSTPQLTGPAGLPGGSAGKRRLPDEVGNAGDYLDICRIALLKELSMRQGGLSEAEGEAARAGLTALLSKGIVFPFFRHFPGLDDRLDLYAEETLVQYHPPVPSDGKGRKVVFHYAHSRRGETGGYRSRPMKEMYRDFYVSGFLLFYGEQMNYYITDDEREKNVVQSGIVGQDARIPENCSGRFGLINETTRAAALREYDRALSLLTDYYRRSYLEDELFRR